jgi:hypothetical protein
MLGMQKDGKLGSNGLASRRDGLFEQMILDLLGQVAPDSYNRLTQGARELIVGG